MYRSKWVLLFVAAIALNLGACAPKEEMVEPEATTPAVEEPTPAPIPVVAVAALQPRNDQTVVGTITFTQGAEGVAIAVRVEEAPPGVHGLHIHEIGDCSSDDFKSAGGHFDPAGMPHGGPDNAERHAGDLGNIEVGEDGVGELSLSSDLITVDEGPSSVLGRGIILHEGQDDLETQPTGAAGGRLACGVIFLQATEADAE